MEQKSYNVFCLDGKPVIVVEDGSVDIDKLEEDGFYVIVYRQGANPPKLLKLEEN